MGLFERANVLAVSKASVLEHAIDVVIPKLGTYPCGLPDVVAIVIS
jgi:hypothetical protein